MGRDIILSVTNRVGSCFTAVKGGEAMFSSFDWDAFFQFLLTALCMFLTFLGGRTEHDNSDETTKK